MASFVVHLPARPENPERERLLVRVPKDHAMVAAMMLSWPTRLFIFRAIGFANNMIPRFWTQTLGPTLFDKQFKVVDVFDVYKSISE